MLGRIASGRTQLATRRHHGADVMPQRLNSSTSAALASPVMGLCIVSIDVRGEPTIL